MENNFIVCQNCGEKNPIENNFCQKCGSPLKEVPVQVKPVIKAAPTKNTKIGCFGIFILLIIVIVIAVSCNGNDTSSAPATPDAAAVTIVGLEQASFDKAVKDQIESINTDNVIGSVKTEVVGNSNAFVKLYLANTDSWTGTSELDQKEFINNLGTLMDAIAVSLTDGVTTGIETQIYSPGGIKLGTRTVWGNVTIEK